MDVMVQAYSKPAAPPVAEAPDPEADRRKLRRLQFELALELGDTGDKPLTETLRQAADAVGGDLLFVLPAPNGDGMAAVVRLPDDGGADCLIGVRTAEVGFSVSDEKEIDADLLGFARASIDVLERLRVDRSILEPLAARN
jgi:hypothetical protein